MAFNKVLVSDFDGTMTQRDFYACAVQYLLSPQDLEPWHAYTRHQITHFEALQRIFERIARAIQKWNAYLNRWNLIHLPERLCSD